MLIALALLQVVATPACGAPDAEGEVVVCARHGESPYRLKKLPPPGSDRNLPGATVRLSERSTLSAEAEQATLPGASAPRAMIRYKLKF